MSATVYDVPSVLRLQHELYHHIQPAATVRDTLAPFLRLLVKRVGGRSAFVFAGDHARIGSLRVRYPLAETLDASYLAAIRSAHRRGDWVADERHPERHARTWRLSSYGTLALITEGPRLAPLLVDALRPVLHTLGEACCAAAERERQHGALERGQSTIASLQRMLDAVPDAVVRLDGDGRIAATNRAWRVVVGERSDHALGRAFIDYLAPDPSRERSREAIGEVVRGERQACHLHDVPWLHSDGSVAHVVISLESLRDGEGRALGCAGTVRDDGERHAAEAAARRAERTLDDREREHGALLAALAHSMRSCQQQLATVSDALRWPAEDVGGAQLGRLERLRTAVAGVTTGLSALASFDAGEHSGAGTIRAFDLEDVAAAVASSEQHRADRVGVTLRTTVRPARLVAARSGLTHALRHLIRYALAGCAPDARLDLSLGVENEPEAPTLRAVLRWPGDERPASDVGAVDRQVARALAQRLGGRVEIVAQPQPSAVLWLPLPQVDTAEPTVALQPPTPAPRGHLALVVEDNPTNALVAREMLTHLGWRSILANDGAEALPALIEHRPDVVLMDIDLPVMDGVEATAKIRRFERGEGIAPVPIIAVTAHAMAADEARYLAAGMDAYLPKPIQLTRLAALLEACLGRGDGDGVERGA